MYITARFSTIFFFSSVFSNQSIRYSMSWCAGCLSWWGPLQRGDLCRGFNELLIELWLLVTEVSTLNLILLTTQTMVTTGILPLQGKIPMVEPGIEPGTSWLVVRRCDHQTTRLVGTKICAFCPQRGFASPSVNGVYFPCSVSTSWSLSVPAVRKELNLGIQ